MGGVGIGKNLHIGGNVHIGENLHFPDDKKLLLGDNNEMQLVHESSGNSFIGDTGTGTFGIVSSGVGVFIQKHPVGVAETLAKFINDGPVELYHGMGSARQLKFANHQPWHQGYWYYECD